MCITPNLLADGTLVGCRNCWQCRERKISDWVGRCIAESKTAVASSVVTLTYGGGDHERMAVLTYSDVQKFFKLLRKRGYPLKYFAIGEYGSLKGRAHWHVIIYWKERMYPHIDRDGNVFGDISGYSPERRRTSDQFRYIDDVWPHGHMVWDKADGSAVRYACKYLQKDIGKEERQAKLCMSKKPPLGHEYFQELAMRYVDQGLAPQDLFYTHEGEVDAKGRKVKFMMGGVTAEAFLEGFRYYWKLAHWDKFPPHSEVVEKFEDSRADYYRAPDLWPRLRPTLRQEELSESEIARREFSAAHDLFYFGAARMGLYEPDWEPDGEEKERSGGSGSFT